MSAASITGPRRARPAPPAPARLTPTTAFAAPAPRPGAPPPLPVKRMTPAVERALGATVKIDRASRPRSLRGFVLGAVLGAGLVLGLAGSDRIRDARATLASALRNMKSHAQAEVGPAERPAPAEVQTALEPAKYTVPPASAEPTPASTIPTYDVRDLPKAPAMPGRRGVPSLLDQNGEERRGDEARLESPGGAERAIFRPDPSRRSHGRAL